MKQLLFILPFGFSIFSFGQNNLVPNPNFDKLNCNQFSTFYDLENWYNPTFLIGSPDIYYYCGTVSKGIPQNSFGHQYPYTDSCYTGIVSSSNVAEYLGIRLITPLKKGFTYCGEFYVSLADTSNFGNSLLGMYFSPDSVYGLNFKLLLEAQIQNDSLNIITDKENWVKVSGSFVAQGGEEYLVIGNFTDSVTTIKYSTKVSNYPFNDYTYYYIDKVSVYACDSPLVEEPQDTTFVFIPNIFSPNQDGENDLWQVTANKVSNLNIQVFNRWGEQVYIFNSQSLQQDTSTTLSVTYNPAWDGYTPTGKPVPEGTYFYIIQYTLPSGETKVEKGSLSLIR